MCAAHHRVDNLLAIIDYNKLQSDDTNASIMGLEPLNAKFSAFGWNVLEIDGHDLDAIDSVRISCAAAASRVISLGSCVLRVDRRERAAPMNEPSYAALRPRARERRSE